MLTVSFVTLNAAFILYFPNGHCEPTTTTEPPCEHFIEGLVPDLELTTNSEIGKDLLELSISQSSEVTPDRRRRRGVNEEDITLETKSSYFHLIFFEDPWVLRVQECLPAGLNETLTFSLNIGLDSCEKSVLVITVIPTQPTLSTSQYEEVDIGNCLSDGTIDVVTLQFSNSNPCVSFTCVVNCTNAEKLFWIYTGTVVRTSAEDVSVGFTYILHVVCKDATDVSNRVDRIEEEFLDVVFTNNAPCTASVASSTTSATLSRVTSQFSQAAALSLKTSTQPSTPGVRISQTQTTPKMKTQMSTSSMTSASQSIKRFTTLSSSASTTYVNNQTEKPKGFFEKPSNVALVSAVAGTGVGTVAGVISVILSSKRCNLRSVVPSNDNNNDEE